MGYILFKSVTILYHIFIRGNSLNYKTLDPAACENKNGKKQTPSNLRRYLFLTLSIPTDHVVFHCNKLSLFQVMQ
jgi:hypothetical protein